MALRLLAFRRISGGNRDRPKASAEVLAARKAKVDSRTFWRGHARSSVTASEGWAGLKDGELLAPASTEFDAFVTVDRKLAAQQDLLKFRIRVLLIRSTHFRLDTHPDSPGKARMNS